MDIITIFAALLKYGLWALLLIGVLACIVAVTFLIYKKVFHGTKKFPVKCTVISILLLAWFAIVFGLTTLSRGANFTGKINLSLFSGYVNAWNEWSLSEYQLIIFNMLMFAPLGFLLPFLTAKGRKLSVACLVSFGVTLLIEVIQFVTGRGIFELDDLLHNFAGSMFGYFFAVFILDCVKYKKPKLKSSLMALSLPLFFCILTLIAVIAYNAQPYGNLPFVPAIKQNMDAVTIQSDAPLLADRQTVPIFQNKYTNDYERGEKISGEFAQFAGIDFNKPTRTEGFNRVYVSDEEQLTVFMQNGNWIYTNWQEAVPMNEADVPVQRKRIEDWLNENNLLPEDAKFTLQDNKILRWDIAEKEMLNMNADSASGMIMVRFDKNGNIATFDYFIVHTQYIGEMNIVTSDEAYQNIAVGNFEQYNPFAKGDTLYIEDCTLSYAPDTKGFYRPVYHFSGYINNGNHPWETIVSAEK